MTVLGEQDLSKLVVIGDRVLIKPKTQNERTKSGLYLPPGVAEREKVFSGYIIKAGPGYPIPAIMENEEPWKDSNDNVKYVPLQAQEGDLAVYLQKSAYDIEFNNEKYVIVPHSALLMVVRDDSLFK